MPSLLTCIAQQVQVSFLRQKLSDDLSQPAQLLVSQALAEDPEYPPLGYKLAVLRLLIGLAESKGVELYEELTPQYTDLLERQTAECEANDTEKTGPLNANALMSTSLLQDTHPTEVRYRLDRSGASGDAHAQSVSVIETPNIISYDGSTGHRTWEGALALADFLLSAGESGHHQPELSVGAKPRIVELGSGTGMVGLVAAKQWPESTVVLTDGDKTVVKTLKSNIKLNSLPESRVVGQSLFWGKDSPVDSDIVLCADVTYDPAAIPLLVTTLKQFLHTARVALLSATVRSHETLKDFESECTNAGLQFTIKQTYTSPFDNVRFFIPPQNSDILIYELSLGQTEQD